nr:Ycf86 [Erythrocladia irregularis]
MNRQKKNTISLGQTVKITQLSTSNCSTINLKLGKRGLIRSLKLTTNNLKLLMVEFKDKARIWFLEDEIELCKKIHS